ncbi:MAG TPA: energy-coupled thiamine transporter ThiT [Clostridiales bacterium]|jgi:thiamine transporter|nr:energy-coupled thiamine transporter ThiT [Clostridiales bacterium]
MFQKLFDFFVTTDGEGGFYPSSAGNVVLFLVILLLFLAMMAIIGRSKKRVDAKQLAFSAAAITLTVVTSMFPLFELPNGGSITLFGMLFISFIGYLYGAKVGILTGIAYGLLDLILEPYVVHPLQLLLDYPIAYGCLGFAGLFAKSKYSIIKGYILGVGGRLLCHVLSGVIFFAEYAGDQNVLFYSLGYNASYIVPEAVVTVMVFFVPAIRSALLEVKRMAWEK